MQREITYTERLFIRRQKKGKVCQELKVCKLEIISKSYAKNAAKAQKMNTLVGTLSCHVSRPRAKNVELLEYGSYLFQIGRDYHLIPSILKEQKSSNCISIGQKGLNFKILK
jgi:hypothetical protein